MENEKCTELIDQECDQPVKEELVAGTGEVLDGEHIETSQEGEAVSEMALSGVENVEGFELQVGEAVDTGKIVFIAGIMDGESATALVVEGSKTALVVLNRHLDSGEINISDAIEYLLQTYLNDKYGELKVKAKPVKNEKGIYVLG